LHTHLVACIQPVNGNMKDTNCLFFYGTKVPFTLYSYETKVSIVSRRGGGWLGLGILLRAFVTSPELQLLF